MNTTLTHIDARHVLRRIPADLRALMREHPLFIAGGFIRACVAGEPVSDIDLFGDSISLGLAAVEIGKARGARIHHSTNAITIVAPPRAALQFITRWRYTDPSVMLSELDFTVCQAAVWYDIDNKAWRTLCTPDFYSDLAARRLVYTHPQRDEEAGGSLMRVRKFLTRGYRIDAASLAGVVARVAWRVRWHEIKEEADAVRVITGLLREVDPLLIIDAVDPVDASEPIDGAP